MRFHFFDHTFKKFDFFHHFCNFSFSNLIGLIQTQNLQKLLILISISQLTRRQFTSATAVVFLFCWQNQIEVALAAKLLKNMRDNAIYIDVSIAVGCQLRRADQNDIKMRHDRNFFNQ